MLPVPLLYIIDIHYHGRARMVVDLCCCLFINLVYYLRTVKMLQRIQVLIDAKAYLHYLFPLLGEIIEAYEGQFSKERDKVKALGGRNNDD